MTAANEYTVDTTITWGTNRCRMFARNGTNGTISICLDDVITYRRLLIYHWIVLHYDHYTGDKRRIAGELFAEKTINCSPRSLFDEKKNRYGVVRYKNANTNGDWDLDGSAQVPLVCRIYLDVTEYSFKNRSVKKSSPI